MQSYLAEVAYDNVTVFCVGDNCRNNVGNWTTHKVVSETKLSGREFYAQKDKAMSKLAEFGFVIWDGKSAGSIANVLELLKLGKKVVVYFSPTRQFYNICDIEGLNVLLDKCDAKAIDVIRKKLRLAKSLHEVEESRQNNLAFV